MKFNIRHLGLALGGAALTLGASGALLEDSANPPCQDPFVRIETVDPEDPGRRAGGVEPLDGSGAQGQDSELLLALACAQRAGDARGLARSLEALRRLPKERLRALLSTLPDDPETLTLALRIGLQGGFPADREDLLRELIERGLAHGDHEGVCRAALELLSVLDSAEFAARMTLIGGDPGAGLGLLEAAVSLHERLDQAARTPFVRSLAASQLAAADGEGGTHRRELATAAARHLGRTCGAGELLESIEDKALPRRERVLAALAGVEGRAFEGFSAEQLTPARSMLREEFGRGLSRAAAGAELDASSDRSMRALAALPGGGQAFVEALVEGSLGRVAAILVAEAMVASTDPPSSELLLERMEANPDPAVRRNLAYAYQRVAKAQGREASPRYVGLVCEVLDAAPLKPSARSPDAELPSTGQEPLTKGAGCPHDAHSAGSDLYLDLLDLLGAHAADPRVQQTLARFAHVQGPLAEAAQRHLDR